MSSATELPEQLPGFDAQAGVARLGGNTQLYQELLLSFFREKHDVIARLSQLLEDGEQASARELVHSVKGVAGNLSADQLFMAAKHLENSLKAEQPVNLHDLKEDFVKQFRQIMETLCSFEQSVAGQLVQQGESPQLDHAGIQAGLAELAGQLEDFSMDAADCFVRLRPSLPAGDELEQLAGAINDLDFDAALELLKTLSNKLDK